VLDNTYVIYMGDNGYHMGAFALPDGKALNIEEDVRIPLWMRGPGIEAGLVLPYQSNVVDLSATILALAGGQPRLS
jgi:arylsulfatase A-like enzyme